MIFNKNHPQKYEEFILGTILAMKICEASEMAPYKVILSSAEIVLELRIDCYWLNELMEKFLKEHPLVPNEKMEIEE